MKQSLFVIELQVARIQCFYLHYDVFPILCSLLLFSVTTKQLLYLSSYIINVKFFIFNDQEAHETFKKRKIQVVLIFGGISRKSELSDILPYVILVCHHRSFISL